MTEHMPGGESTPPDGRLARPTTGRYVAGVCAAIGRATHTDPVLWRVILAVLVCFGGTGVLAYIGLWLLTPEDSDTASPLEALFGRGRSNTTPALVVLLGIAAVLTLVFVLVTVGPLFLALVGGGALVLWAVLNGRASAPPPPHAPAPHQPAPPQQPAPLQQPAPPQQPAASTAAPRAAATPETPAPDTVAPETPAPAAAASDGGASGDGAPEATSSDAATPAATTPDVTAPGTDTGLPHTDVTGVGEPGGPPPAGGAPFAPHGPFAGTAGAAGPTGPAGPPQQPPQPPPAPSRPVPPRPPRPPREPSRLPWLTLCVMLAVLGALGLVHAVTPMDLRATTYVVAALAVTGAGLVVGAWWGRARSLIALGIVVTLALPVVHVVELVRAWEPERPVATSVVWRPEDVDALDDEYGVSFGEGQLDMRDVDFTGEDVHVDVSVEGGEINVTVPPWPDVRVEGEVLFGQTRLFGDQHGGMATSPTVIDRGATASTTPGPDDSGAGDAVDGSGRPGGSVPDTGGRPGGAGMLTLELDVRFGEITVSRG